MSAKATFWAFDQQGLKPIEKLTLLILADFANDEDECWPSYARIAKDSNVTRRTAIDVVQRLEKRGYLKIVLRKKADGDNSTNIFKLLVTATARQAKLKKNALKSAAPSENISPPETPETDEAPLVKNIHPLVKDLHPPGEIDAQNLVKNIHPLVNQASPKSTIESKNSDGVGGSLPERGQPKFRMPNNWQPRKEFKTHADKHGVKTIDELDLDDFRLHWGEEIHQRTQAQWENKFLEHLLHRQGMKIKKIKPQPDKTAEPANELMGKLNALRTLKQHGKLNDSGKLDSQIAEAEQALLKLRGVR